jgi:CTP:molybdopterin cytidylyltransferase MocA
MGEQKLFMPIKGMPMMDFVIKTVLSCGFDSLPKASVVVSMETLKSLAPVEGAEYIVNPDPDRGKDSSFRRALSALPELSSFAVFLADKPAVTPEQIMELLRRFLSLSAEKNALIPRKGDAPGHPAFYSHLWRERFLNSDNCRATLFRHEEDVEWVEFGDSSDNAHGNFFLDVDTPEDYRRIAEMTNRWDKR